MDTHTHTHAHSYPHMCTHQTHTHAYTYAHTQAKTLRHACPMWEWGAFPLSAVTSGAAALLCHFCLVKLCPYSSDRKQTRKWLGKRGVQAHRRKERESHCLPGNDTSKLFAGVDLKLA
ncbi:rCG44164 [Rattus norvegicus]|uniref:RCG44164 n=1 Tax=Rattus norvegicus TaxID=10116 RepID=A6J7B9_RAT|nr:rCG44164 [Rattus norvegicus]